MKNMESLQEIKKIISTELKNKEIDDFKIYCFGSRARGDFSEHSDFDLMIIVKAISMKSKIKLFSLLRKKLAKERYNVDIIIKSIKEIEYYKEKVGHIVKTALQEGYVI